VQSVVALCFDRSDALVWLHGGGVTVSAVDAVERFSCGGAGQHLGFTVGLSGEGGGFESLIRWGVLARTGVDSAGGSGLMSPNGHRER